MQVVSYIQIAWKHGANMQLFNISPFEFHERKDMFGTKRVCKWVRTFLTGVFFGCENQILSQKPTYGFFPIMA